MGEPILISFNMKNFIPLTVEVSNIKLHLKHNKKFQLNMLSPNS